MKTKRRCRQRRERRARTLNISLINATPMMTLTAPRTSAENNLCHQYHWMIGQLYNQCAGIIDKNDPGDEERFLLAPKLTAGDAAARKAAAKVLKGRVHTLWLTLKTMKSIVREKASKSAVLARCAKEAAAAHQFADNAFADEAVPRGSGGEAVPIAGAGGEAAAARGEAVPRGGDAAAATAVATVAAEGGDTGTATPWAGAWRAAVGGASAGDN